MKPMVERFQYLALLTVFVGVAVGLVFDLGVQHRLDLQIQTLQAISKAQTETLNRLQSDSAVRSQEFNNQLQAIQEQHRVQDEYLTCLVSLFTQNKLVTTLQGCQAPFMVITPASSVAPVSKATPSHSASPAPTPTPTPTPQPRPVPPGPLAPVQDIIKFIRGLLP